MSKPTRKVEIETVEGFRTEASALIDSGSFHSLIQADCVPNGALIFRYKEPKTFGTAQEGGKLVSVGKIYLIVHLEGHSIDLDASVCPDLTAQVIIGAGEMQRWDISIQNANGHTSIHIGHDLNDPDIQTVL